MSQVTIYLPPAVAAKARREAKRRKTSLSAYIVSLLEPDQQHEKLARQFERVTGLHVIEW
jgi:macrodomain Ter protein organizer (MatP/YcbG family)